MKKSSLSLSAVPAYGVVDAVATLAANEMTKRGIEPTLDKVVAVTTEVLSKLGRAQAAPPRVLTPPAPARKPRKYEALDLKRLEGCYGHKKHRRGNAAMGG